MIGSKKLAPQGQEGSAGGVRLARDKRMYVVTALTCTLALVWPLPHTIALRNVLMLVLLVLLIPRTQWSLMRQAVVGPAKGIAAFYLLFTLWALLEAAFVSPFSRWSFSEINGQWFSAAVALLLGLSAAAQKDGRYGRMVCMGVLAVLGIQVLAVDAEGLWTLFSGGALGHMARLGGLSAGPGKASYLTNFLLCALVAELSLRMDGRRDLGISTKALAGLLALCAVSVYFEAMRNELFDVGVFMVFVGFVGYLKYAKHAPARALLVASASIIVLIGASAVDVAVDPRWRSLCATIPIALDTTRHLAWLNGRRFPLPHLPDGHVVSASNYLRIAWLKEGLLEIVAHPLGVGFGRSAFGHALRLRYGNLSGDTGLNNSLITIGIGTGIPGLVLWMGWFFSLGKFAVRYFSGPTAFYARFLLLVVSAFGVRMAMDNVMQNYTLEQVLYFVGLLGLLCILPASGSDAEGLRGARSWVGRHGANEQGGR